MRTIPRTRRSLIVVLLAGALVVAGSVAAAVVATREGDPPVAVGSDSFSADQLEASDRHVLGFAAASNPAVPAEEAADAYTAAEAWPENVVRVERVITARQAALRLVGKPEAAPDDRQVAFYRLTGNFVLRGMSQPKGTPEISGQYAYVAVDPTTGTGVDVGMGDREFPLEDLGDVVVIFGR